MGKLFEVEQFAFLLGLFALPSLFLLLSIEVMKELNSSRVTARHSHVMPPNPSSSLSVVRCSATSASSIGSVSLSVVSETFLRLLARSAAFAFFEFFFAFGAGGGDGVGSALRYNRLSSRTTYVRSSESQPKGSILFARC
jgi:hypothetical protein